MASPSDDTSNATGRNERSPANGNDMSLRTSLRLCVFSIFFAAIWSFTITGATQTRFAKQLGMDEFGFGLLAALPFAGALMWVPASFLFERFGHRKLLFITTGILHRLMWVVIAAVPWVLPDRAQVFGFLFALMISRLLAGVAMPGVVSWLADLIPGRIRGRYSARRQQVWAIGAIALPLLVGKVLDEATDVSELTMRIAISSMFAVAGICGAINFVIYIVVPDRKPKTPMPEMTIWRVLREPLRDRDFVLFLGYAATVTFATGYMLQFLMLYLMDVVFAASKSANLLANVLVLTGPGVVSFAVYPIWGRLIDRLGRKPVLMVGGALTGVGVMGWVFMTPDLWWIGYILAVAVAVAWPGVELARYNVMLWMGESRAGGRHQGTAYLAVNAIVVAVAGMASGLFAGLLAKALGDWQGVLFGWPMTYHRVLFIISAVLHFLSLPWLIWMAEPASFSTRDALRYMAAGLYANLQHVVFTPARLAGHLGRLTYKLNPNRPTDRRGPPDR